MASTQEAKSSLLHDMEPVGTKENARSGSPDNSSRNKLIATVVLLVVSFCILAFVVASTVASFRNDPKRMARFSVVMDSESGEVIKDFPLPDGHGYPAKNSKTGKATLYPAEPCYWTKDGKAKLDPTYVILNAWFGKAEQTRCPDCGRTVTKGNKMPPDNLMQAAWDAAHR